MKFKLVSNKSDVIFSTLAPGTFCEATEAMNCKAPDGQNEIYIVCGDLCTVFNIRTSLVSTPRDDFKVRPLVQSKPLDLRYADEL